MTSSSPGKENSQSVKLYGPWDKLDVISKLMLGVLGTAASFVVGYLGYQGNKTLQQFNERVAISDSCSRALEFDTQHQMAMAQLRAQAYAALGSLTAELTEDDRKVALLAGLHSTFSEFFDTRPVLETFARSFKDKTARTELKRLAMRVARRQVEALSRQGGSCAKVDMTLPAGAESATWKGTLEGHEIEVIADSPIYIDEQLASLSSAETTEGNCADAGDVRDTIHLKVSVERGPELGFTLSFLDSPMLDHLTIRHDRGQVHHVGFVLDGLQRTGDGDRITLTIVHFPDAFITPNDLRDELLGNLKPREDGIPEHVDSEGAGHHDGD